MNIDKIIADIEKQKASNSIVNSDKAWNNALDMAVEILRTAQEQTAQGVEDVLRSKPDYHNDNIEQLAFELACELEDAELSHNDFVTVNREKLKAIATRVYTKLKQPTMLQERKPTNE